MVSINTRKAIEKFEEIACCEADYKEDMKILKEELAKLEKNIQESEKSIYNFKINKIKEEFGIK